MLCDTINIELRYMYAYSVLESVEYNVSMSTLQNLYSTFSSFSNTCSWGEWCHVSTWIANLSMMLSDRWCAMYSATGKMQAQNWALRNIIFMCLMENIKQFKKRDEKQRKIIIHFPVEYFRNFRNNDLVLSSLLRTLHLCNKWKACSSARNGKNLFQV